MISKIKPFRKGIFGCFHFFLHQMGYFSTDLCSELQSLFTQFCQNLNRLIRLGSFIVKYIRVYIVMKCILVSGNP